MGGSHRRESGSHVMENRGENKRREKATSQVKVWLARREINFTASLFHQKSSIRGRRKRQTFYSPVTPGAADMTNYQQMEGHISKPDKILILREESEDSGRRPIIFRLMWQWVTAKKPSHICSESSTQSWRKSSSRSSTWRRRFLLFLVFWFSVTSFLWFCCVRRHQGSPLPLKRFFKITKPATGCARWTKRRPGSEETDPPVLWMICVPALQLSLTVYHFVCVRDSALLLSLFFSDAATPSPV